MSIDTTGWTRADVEKARQGFIQACAWYDGRSTESLERDTYIASEAARHIPMPFTTVKTPNVKSATDSIGRKIEFRQSLISDRIEYRFATPIAARAWYELQPAYWPDMTESELKAIIAVRKDPVKVTREEVK